MLWRLDVLDRELRAGLIQDVAVEVCRAVSRPLITCLIERSIGVEVIEAAKLAEVIRVPEIGHPLLHTIHTLRPQMTET